MEAAKGNDIMRAGDRVVFNQGPHAGYTARVVDPVAVPDGQPHQRKVLVRMEEDGAEIYVLPRQVDLHEEQHVTDTQIPMAAMVDQIPQPVRIPTVQDTEGRQVIIPRTITDPMDPALDAFRPDPSVVDSYVSRKVVGGYNDIEFLLHMREQRDSNGYSPNVALVGDTQSGKTILMEVLAVVAAERDGMPKPYPLFTINGSAGISNYDLYGKTTSVFIDGQEVLVWMEGLVPLAARCGAFLYLDEWNAVPASQAVGIHPLLDDRRRFTNTHKAIEDGHGGYMPEIVHAHPKMFVVSTINPLGYKGIAAMAEATSNRFRWLEWGYDTDVEAKLIPSAAVRDLAALLRAQHELRRIKTPVGVSALHRLNQDLANYGAKTALWIFLGLFQERTDRVLVEELIENENIESRMAAEYPRPVFEEVD